MSDIFNNLLYHLIESTVWSFLFIGLLPLLRLKDSNLRCWVYRIALLKFLFPSVWLVSLIEVNPQEELMPLMVVFADPIETFTSASAPQTGFSFAMVLWIFVIMVMLIYTSIVIYRMFFELKSVSQRLNKREETVLNQALKSMNLPEGSIHGYSAETKVSIGLFGIFRPRIIAKHEFLEVLNERELIAAFQHEIAHKIRWDNAWRLCIDLITCLIWFHPIVWYLKKRCLVETEKACDERVIRAGQTTNTYANCLLKAVEFSHSNGYFCSTALSETSIKTRVSNILNYEKGNKPIMKTIVIITAAIALISGSFTLLASTETTSVSVKKDNTIYDIGDVDVKPKPTRQVQPVYPMELKEQQIGGKVVLVFIIEKDGSVSNPRVETSTHVEFEGPSIDALKQWKFSPGEKNGVPVQVRVRAPLIFQLGAANTKFTVSYAEGFLDRVETLAYREKKEIHWAQIAKYGRSNLEKIKTIDDSELQEKQGKELMNKVARMVKERRFISEDEFAQMK